MEITQNTKVGEIVRYNFTTARLFESHKIDFCCGGNISVHEAALKEGVDTGKLVKELKSLITVKDKDTLFIESLSLSALSLHIIETHHRYVNENIPFLIMKLLKLCDVHGENHPELFEIYSLFSEMAGNLTLHMKKEELIVFPYISMLEKSHFEGTEKPKDFPRMKSLTGEMEQEHQAEGDRFVKIAALSKKYRVPSDGCNTFEVTYRTLAAFEKDLHRHIHLENNVLFPKAAGLERKLTE